VAASGRLIADRPQDEAIGRRGIALVPARETRVTWRPERSPSMVGAVQTTP
jgi:hypothetical protein